jgi:hypothetical protein
MNPTCNKPWTRRFLNTSFTSAFINTTLKEHQANVAFEKEKALFPATQPAVEKVISIRRIEKEISTESKQRETYQTYCDTYKNNYLSAVYMVKYHNIYVTPETEKSSLTQQLEELETHA